VVIRGKVAPLLELGAGFHPELTGRENVFLNSALLGRTKKDVERLLPEIAAFAEIGDFLESPLRTYSTGMVARLGFAVATAERPEILLVDEVLSVGDAAFQQKCLDRMYAFQDQGTTVIMVSHGMSTIEAFCNRAIWLDRGDLKAEGKTQEVIRSYIEADKTSEIAEKETEKPVPVTEIPIFRAKPEMDEEQKFAHLAGTRHIYPADPVLSVRQGTVSLWHRFDPETEHRTAILFHSDDSRYVLYTSVDLANTEKPIRLLTARAGGNRRVLETYFGDALFPEVTVPLNAESQLYATGNWHMITMTWTGYPDGQLCLYIDDQLMGKISYDRRYDNQYRLAEEFSVGVRPPQWVGELVQKEDGSVEDLRPQATLSVEEGGQQIKNVRLYRHCLASEEIKSLYLAQRDSIYSEFE
jgi:ABC-type multidrug transport system ATPase subunit